MQQDLVLFMLYERQTSTGVEAKVKSFNNHYSIKTHKKTDNWHTEELIVLICKLDEKRQQQVCQSTIEGAKVSWRFLDGVNASYAN